MGCHKSARSSQSETYNSIAVITRFRKVHPKGGWGGTTNRRNVLISADGSSINPILIGRGRSVYTEQLGYTVKIRSYLWEMAVNHCHGFCTTVYLLRVLQRRYLAKMVTRWVSRRFRRIFQVSFGRFCVHGKCCYKSKIVCGIVKFEIWTVE